MKINFSASRLVVFLATMVLFPCCMPAQSGSGSGGSGKPNNGSISTQPTAPVVVAQPIFISGKVLIDGGGPPPEPAVIERVCTGSVRREGYTDSKGAFQFQLDQNVGFEDASENNSTLSSPGQSGGSSTTRSQQGKAKYQGCEIRAVLAGFLSTTAQLQLQGNAWQYDLGTIFLKRAEGTPGTAVSVTTLSAPKDAQHAYQKGRKEFDENKLSSAEKELDKAVKIYPNFAAAWSLLGDIHVGQQQFDQAFKEYTQALAADPQYVNPVFGLTLVALEQKRWPDALEYSDRVLKMNALAFPAAYFYNAVANYNLGKTELAEANARKFRSLDTDHLHPDNDLLLSQIDIQKRNLFAAAEEMRDYLIQAPDSPKAEEVREWLKHYEETGVAKQQ